MKLKTALFISSLSLMGSLAWAGPSSGGGGMVVTCLNDNGDIQSTELLDVYEARHNPNLTVMQASGDLEEDFFRTVENTYALQGHPGIAKSLKEYILKQHKNFLAVIDWKEELPFLNDQGNMTVELPTNCRLEQLAIFYDSIERVAINKNIWLRLDSLNRAALTQHEMFYFYERKSAERTSESTRSYVRQIVSTAGYTPVNAGVELANGAGTAYAGKTSDITDFLVHHTKNELGTEDLTLQFTNITGRPILVKTTATIPNFILAVECHPWSDCVPTVSTNKILRVPIVTEHRQDWELVVRYVSKEPVTFTLMQHGVPLETLTLHSFE